MRPILPLILLGVVLDSPWRRELAEAFQDSEIRPAAIQQEWKSLAESLDNVSLTSVETMRDSKTGESREETFHFVRGSEGRAALSVVRVTPKGRNRALDMREDGRWRYDLNYSRDYPDALSSVEIRPQISTARRFDGHMPRALWLIMPFGKTLHQVMLDGGTIVPAGQASPRPVLKASEGDQGLEAILSNHDGLPEELRLESPQGRMSLRITRYQAVNGRWFPKEGEGEEETFARKFAIKRTFHFRLRDVSFNDDLAPSTFSEPSYPTGVIIYNKLTKKTRIEGGPEGRKAWEKKHPALVAQVKEPIIAADPPKESYGSVLFMTSFVMFAILAVCLYVRGRAT